jgi:hypothetical protein
VRALRAGRAGLAVRAVRAARAERAFIISISIIIHVVVHTTTIITERLEIKVFAHL